MNSKKIYVGGLLVFGIACQCVAMDSKKPLWLQAPMFAKFDAKKALDDSFSQGIREPALRSLAHEIKVMKPGAPKDAFMKRLQSQGGTVHGCIQRLLDEEEQGVIKDLERSHGISPADYWRVVGKQAQKNNSDSEGDSPVIDFCSGSLSDDMKNLIRECYACVGCRGSLRVLVSSFNSSPARVCGSLLEISDSWVKELERDPALAKGILLHEFSHIQHDDGGVVNSLIGFRQPSPFDVFTKKRKEYLSYQRLSRFHESRADQLAASESLENAVCHEKMCAWAYPLYNPSLLWFGCLVGTLHLVNRYLFADLPKCVFGISNYKVFMARGVVVGAAYALYALDNTYGFMPGPRLDAVANIDTVHPAIGARLRMAKIIRELKEVEERVQKR